MKLEFWQRSAESSDSTTSIMAQKKLSIQIIRRFSNLKEKSSNSTSTQIIRQFNNSNESYNVQKSTQI